MPLSAIPSRALLAALAVLLPAAAAISPVAAAPVRGGSLTVGLYASPSSLDPAGQSGDAGAQALMYAVYDPLVDVQADGSWKPALATQVERSPDSRTWTVTLRDKVRFQDGTPFNAAAVAAHFKRLADPATRCACLATVKAIESLSTPDAKTVVFKLSNGWAAFPVQVLGASFAFIPSPTAVAAAGADYPRKPVGTGPFQLVEFTRGSRLVVERNPAYWRANLPYLDKIIYRPLPDEQTRLQSLRAGDIDLMQTINPAQVEQARAAGLMARINMGLGSQMIMFDTTREPLNDGHVRRALALAINREALSKLMTAGIAKPGMGPLGAGSAANGPARWPGFDPKAARDLLQAYGKPVTFEMLALASPDGRKQAEVLQQMWRAVGAEVSITLVDTPQLIDRVLFKKNYQASAWVGQEFPEPDGLFDGYHASGRFNVMKYNNPKVNALLELARLNADPKVRTESYQQVNQRIADDVPALYLYRKVGALIHKPAVQNVPAAEWVGVQIFRPTEIWLQP